MPTQPTNCSNLTPRISQYLHEIPSCQSQSFGTYFTVHEIETATVYQDAKIIQMRVSLPTCQLANLSVRRPANLSAFISSTCLRHLDAMQLPSLGKSFDAAAP
jgi:hypothetical protein